MLLIQLQQVFASPLSLTLSPVNCRWTEADSGRGEKEPNRQAALLLLLQPQQVSASSYMPSSLSYLLTTEGLRQTLEEGRRSLTARQRCCCCCNLSRYLPALTTILSLLPANYRWTETCSGRGEKEPNSQAALLLLLQPQQVSASSHCHPH